ncbi:hypothetical protein NQ314_010635 [Rhamnusium bicolor]|uniref:Uncharacterized protein n=1 Tax=Rhamnusium bicolor TaxID=1586634 RepID=A0AAV8XNZ6_9CUCU|nr:hypothetical protein NQ314_010635 [Rhamnusium bicolor]
MEDAVLNWLLLEEEEEEEMLVLNFAIKPHRQSERELFKRRTKEGYGNLLIRGHFSCEDDTFRQFFHLNRQQFHFVLNHVGDCITKTPYARVVCPISAEEKLCLTLR